MRLYRKALLPGGADHLGGFLQDPAGLDVVRANPIPVALIGLGVAWLISNNTGMTDRVAGTASNMSRRVTDTATDIADTKERKVFKFIWTPHLHCAVCACVVEKKGSIIERR